MNCTCYEKILKRLEGISERSKCLLEVLKRDGQKADSPNYAYQIAKIDICRLLISEIKDSMWMEEINIQEYRELQMSAEEDK